MTPAEFRIRCRVAESCLPDAEYRKKLTELHDEMLAVIEQPAPAQEPVAYQNVDVPQELIAAGRDWENIDPMWHFMFRPLYTTPPAPAQPLTREEVKAIIRAEVEGVTVSEMVCFLSVANAAIDAFCAKNGITKGGE